MHRKVVLDNGVRLVAERLPTVKSVTLGVWVGVGARDERSGEAGLSHFIEHMFFKGTATRSALQISREIDALGGEMNAFTTHETTTFYLKVLDQQFKPALALLADLFHHSRFHRIELEKEKQVVLEEIRTVQDDPEELVHELHAEHALPQHPLGRPILGDEKTIRGLDRRELLGFVRHHYDPSRVVVALAGNFQWPEALRLLAGAFGRFEWTGRAQPMRRPPELAGGLLVRPKPLEQAHLCVGLKGLPLADRDRYVGHALNVVLGGSVSSRLFHEIRERRGLAYSIYSHLTSFSDSGMLNIYAATRPGEAPKVIELICRELRRLRKSGADRQELARAKTQMKGGLMLSLENTHSRMNKLAKDELYLGRHQTLEEIIAAIDRVTGEDLLRLSQDLLNFRRLSVTALGPVSRRSLEQSVA